MNLRIGNLLGQHGLIAPEIEAAFLALTGDGALTAASALGAAALASLVPQLPLIWQSWRWF
jgi:hypothetical protein